MKHQSDSFKKPLKIPNHKVLGKGLLRILLRDAELMWRNSIGLFSGFSDLHKYLRMVVPGSGGAGVCERRWLHYFRLFGARLWGLQPECCGAGMLGLSQDGAGHSEEGAAGCMTKYRFNLFKLKTHIFRSDRF